MPRIPDEIIADIRQRTDLVQIARRYVELKRAGIGRWKGLCPFHQEKTPSFHVSEDNFFKCFGCDAKGDTFSFLQQIEHYSFMEAVEELAREAGIDLPTQEMSPAEKRASEQAQSERSRMIQITEMAVTHYQEVLATPRGATARAYLERRAITTETIEKFRLGYAPADGDSLHAYLAEKKMPFADVERLGLVRRNERGIYDFFRDRVMFPVFDRQKRAVGFSGRMLDPEAKAAKYINTPDSPIFHKKDLLYALHLAQPAIRRTERALVVEGQADVIALHQAGIEEAVAPMGTALTADHIELLGRLARQIVVVFDGDEAGQRAARRVLPLFLDAHSDGRVVRLPRGVDPDDFIREKGGPAMQTLLAGAAPMMERFIDDLAGETDETIPGRVEALDRAAPLLAKVRNQTERELYVGRLATALRLRGDQVWRAVRSAHAESTRAPHPGRAVEATTPEVPLPETSVAARREPPARLEMDALGLWVSNTEDSACREEAPLVLELLIDPDLRRLFRATSEAVAAGKSLEMAAWIEACPTEIRDVVWRAVMSDRWKGMRAPGLAMRDLAAQLRVKRLEAEILLVDRTLKGAITRGDEQEVRALTQRIVELRTRKQELLTGPG